MKKKLSVIAAVLCTVMLLCGCTNKSLMTVEFQVTSGEYIEVSVDTANGFELDEERPLDVIKDGEVVMSGVFISADEFENKKDAIADDKSATIIESDETAENPYFFYTYENQKFLYCIHINNSDTAVLVSTYVSEDMARECFENLTFAVK